MQATKEQGAQWFAQAVNLLPQEAATDGDKSRLLLVTAEVAGRDELKSRIGCAYGDMSSGRSILASAGKSKSPISRRRS